jgi:hypothetical protein
MRRCCRSNPRCGDCPVVGLATARRQRHLDEQATLVTEILAGFRLRTLPPSVEAALVSLEAGYRPPTESGARVRTGTADGSSGLLR